MATRFNTDKASPSKYANFLDCPMKFWIFQLHPNSRDFHTKGLTIGNVVDQTLNRFFRREPDNRTLESLQADFDLAWLREKDLVDGWNFLAAEEEQARADCLAIIESFFRTFDVKKTPIYFPPLNTIPKQERFNTMLKLPLTPDLTIQGWGDRVDQNSDGFEIIDYKTKSGAELYEERNNLQLRMYGLIFDDWLMRNGYSGKVIKLTFAYLTGRGVELRSFDFTDADRQTTVDEIKMINRQLKEHWNNFQVNPWPCSCGSCDRLLAKMEERAGEWAKAKNAPATQALLVDNLPF